MASRLLRSPRPRQGWAAIAALLVLSVAHALVVAGPEDGSLEDAAMMSGGILANSAATGASMAARRAWTLTKDIKVTAKKNLKFIPLIKAEVAMAKAAADTAAEKDKEATKLYEKVKAEAWDAANKAAQDYLSQVRAVAAAATNQASSQRAAKEVEAEVRAGQAAAKAAMPYNANLLRMQKVTVAYEQRAHAMAAASNNLKGEGASLAASANQYQAVGQTVKANQIMVQAHSLFDQGERLKEAAEELHETATEIYSALPMYQKAEQSAADSAAASVNPPAFEPEKPYPY